MTISKITQSNIHPLEQVDKINEIIDKIEDGVFHGQKLYAWEINSINCIVYSLSETLTNNDAIYNIDGSLFLPYYGDIGQQVTSTYFSYNSILQFWRVGFTYGGGSGSMGTVNSRVPDKDTYVLQDSSGQSFPTGIGLYLGGVIQDALTINTGHNDAFTIKGVDSYNNQCKDITFYGQGARVAVIRAAISDEGNARSLILGCSNNNNDAPSGITVSRVGSTVTCTAPTPSDNDNSTKISTTAFVKKACDGTYSNTNDSITSSATSLNGSSDLTYTLSLPSDSRNYMVLLSGMVETGSTSGNRAALQIRSDLQTSGVNVCGARTRTSSTMSSYGAVWLPVSSNHKIYVTRDSDYNGTFRLWIRGYRRIGVNS